MEARNRIAVALLFLCGISCPATASFSAPVVVPKSPRPPVQGIRVEEVRASVTVVQSATTTARSLPRESDAHLLPMFHVAQRALVPHAADAAGVSPQTASSYRIISFE